MNSDAFGGLVGNVTLSSCLERFSGVKSGTLAVTVYGDSMMIATVEDRYWEV